ncbi:MAG: response regulator transcription factor [Anaerolineae bacterium]|nr:response regulator transcription factor [Anaerolineae bacterium]
MIRVILVEDHHLVRQGIRALLEKVQDIQIIGEAADGREAVELVQRLAPDVVVMDIAMPRLDGIQAIAQVQALTVNTQVIVLSMYDDEILVRQALQSGARGYLLKSSVAEELVLAIRAASRGETYLSPSIAGCVVGEFLKRKAGEPSTLADRLTPREREVLQLIAEGHTNTGIAHMLKVSARTVERHRANLMSKLEADNVADLLRTAIQHRLIFPDL